MTGPTPEDLARLQEAVAAAMAEESLFIPYTRSIPLDRTLPDCPCQFSCQGPDLYRLEVRSSCPHHGQGTDFLAHVQATLTQETP